MQTFEIEISAKQKARIALALREFAKAHPEIEPDDYSEMDSDNPNSLAEMLDQSESDRCNSFIS